MNEFIEDDDVYPKIMSVDLIEMQIMDIAEQDSYWAGFSILFVFIFFIIKLKSSFLAGMAILLILMSFPFT